MTALLVAGGVFRLKLAGTVGHIYAISGAHPQINQTVARICLHGSLSRTKTV